jgi:toxin ParE1/3/4
MRIRWTPAAAADLEQIKHYLTEHMPELAESTVLRLYASIRSLKAMPKRGRTGRAIGTRELVLTPLPYIVVYRIKGDAVEILHLHHGAQDWR